MRGGDWYEIKRAKTTPKAWAQYLELVEDKSVKSIDLMRWLIGKQVRVLADDAPYLILNDTGIRFVFCIQHGKTVHDGAFCLVTACLDYGVKDQ